MRWIKRIVVLLVVLSSAMYGLLFASKNMDRVNLDLLFVTLPKVNVGTLVMASLLVGLLLGLLLNFWVTLKNMSASAKAKRQITKLQTQVNQQQPNG